MGMGHDQPMNHFLTIFSRITVFMCGSSCRFRGGGGGGGGGAAVMINLFPWGSFF